MNLIPVIDLLDGKVVHAVAGERSHYRPFSDSRFPFDSPDRLIDLFLEEYRPEFIYVADLNSILGNGNNLAVMRRWNRFDVRFLIDLGFRNWHDVTEAKSELGDLDWIPVLGTETFESIGLVVAAGRDHSESLFVSIDVRGQQVMEQVDRPSTPLEYLRELVEQGIRNIIILDLDSVGVQSGYASYFSSMVAMAEPAARKFADARLFAGGGVRDMDDVKRLSELGFSGVLAATSLHQGKITGEDILSLDH